MSEKTWNELTQEQKKTVTQHHKKCITDEKMNCKNLCKTVETFWENHKNADYPNWE